MEYTVHRGYNSIFNPYNSSQSKTHGMMKGKKRYKKNSEKPVFPQLEMGLGNKQRQYDL